MINDPRAREIENINATENAISAFAKILKYNKSALTNLDELIAVWFSWLPISEDPEEAVHIYGYLCDLIEGNHPAILAQTIVICHASFPSLQTLCRNVLKQRAHLVPAC